MRRALSVAAQEVRGRARLLAVAAAVGLFPVLAPLLPQVAASDRTGIAICLFLIVTLVVAPLVGAAVLSPELASRRLGFYLARPLSIASLVGGKLAGGLALVAAAQLLALAPTALLDGRVRALGSGAGWVLFSCSTVALFCAGLVAGMLLRLTSRVLLADAAALLVWAGLLSQVVHRWGFAWAAHQMQWTQHSARQASDQLCWAMSAAVVALTIVWLAAAIAAVARGRSDGARVHRTVSLLGWSVSLAVTALLIGAWNPPHGVGPPLVQNGAGWAVVEDAPWGPSFREPGTNRVLTPPRELRAHYAESPVALAHAAPRAVWIRQPADWLGQRPARGASHELASLDLATRHLTRVPLAKRQVWGAFAVSPDGATAAMAADGEIWAVDLATGRVIFDGKGPRVATALFSAPRTLRLYAKAGNILEIHELDLDTAALRRTKELDGPAALWWGRPSLDGARVLSGDKTTICARDASTGACPQLYPSLGELSSHFAVLPDGAVAVASGRDDHLVIHRGAEGVWGAPIQLGPGETRFLQVWPIAAQPQKVHVRTGRGRFVIVDLREATAMAVR